VTKKCSFLDCDTKSRTRAREESSAVQRYPMNYRPRPILTPIDRNVAKKLKREVITSFGRNLGALAANAEQVRVDRPC
jgi:hypothetical protein